MVTTVTTRRQVDDFLACRRLAVVGVSRDPKHFSYVLWQELRQRGYEAIPVNPYATDLDGQPCYPRVQAIDPPVDGVLVMTPSSATAQVVRDFDRRRRAARLDAQGRRGRSGGGRC